MPVTVTVVVAAAPDAVWSTLTDVDAWPRWNPACGSAELDGPLATGRRLRLQLRHPKGRLFFTAPVVTAVDAPALLAWETRALGLRAPTTITLVAHDGGTLVTLASSSRGVLAFAYRIMFPEPTQGLVWSGALTGLASAFAPSGEDGETPISR